MISRSMRSLLVALAAAAVLMPSINDVQAQSGVTEYRPNLVAMPAFGMTVVKESRVINLRFSTMSWNSGLGALELRAGAIDLDQLTRKVYQRVFRSDGTHFDNLAGDFVYHPEHAHFHFEDYALYRLVPENAPGASERQSAKTTFCVMDTNKIPNTPGPAFPVYSTCGADIQGMSIGWADTYGSHLFGQSFDVSNSPDGDYKLIIEIDPRLRILESDESDNSACVRVRLNVSSRTVQNLGDCATQGTVAITSVTPNSVFQGTVTTDVMIAGSGFTNGMAVGFENGSGPAPIVSDVQYIDSTAISFTVTVKSGGARRERLWDLRVGPAVLPKAFTIRP